jgi:hypothetical protein
MISSTEGEIMPAKKKGKPIGVDEPDFAEAQLYWTILRDNPEYRKDYEEYENDPDGKFIWFTDKWSMLKPLNPCEWLNPENVYCLDSNKPAPIHLFPDNTPKIPVSSKVISKNSYKIRLELELDLRCTKKILKNEIEKIIEKEAYSGQSTSLRKNLLGDNNLRTIKEYYNMIYIYNKKKEEKEPEEIYKMSIEDEQYFYSKGSFLHYCRTIDDLIKDFPVPIKNNSS